MMDTCAKCGEEIQKASSGTVTWTHVDPGIDANHHARKF